MAKLIVVIGPDAEQNRQFVEQRKYRQVYELPCQQVLPKPAASYVEQREPPPTPRAEQEQG